MFNVCTNCANWHDKREIDLAGPYAICPDCGYKQLFNYLPLFVLTGPSGAGKSTATLALMGQLPDFVLLEGDIFWRDEFNQPNNDYLTFRNICLRAAKSINQSGRPTVLSGTSTPGQYETCPEFCYFDGVHYLALVCQDEELERRLKERPSWRKSGSTQFINDMLAYNRWFKENGHLVTLLDTTDLTVVETAVSIKIWLSKIYKKEIDRKLL